MQGSKSEDSMKVYFLFASLYFCLSFLSLLFAIFVFLVFLEIYDYMNNNDFLLIKYLAMFWSSLICFCYSFFSGTCSWWAGWGETTGPVIAVILKFHSLWVLVLRIIWPRLSWVLNLLRIIMHVLLLNIYFITLSRIMSLFSSDGRIFTSLKFTPSVPFKSTSFPF